jgi:hypothetical protein
MPITGERGHPILTGEEELAIFTQGEAQWSAQEKTESRYRSKIMSK